MANKLYLRRGSGAVPVLNPGEPAFALDTGVLYVGQVSGVNAPINSSSAPPPLKTALFGYAEAWATATPLFDFDVPALFNGMKLTGVIISCSTPSSSGLPGVSLSNLTTTQAITTTDFTIDEADYDSRGATTPGVINPSTNTVATGDRIGVYITGVGTGTTGGWITFVFTP
jgi:hypothetical protein